MYRFGRNAAVITIGLQGCPSLAIGQIAIPLRPEHPRSRKRVGPIKIGYHPPSKQHDRARGTPGELLGPNPKATIAIDQGRNPLGFQLSPLSLRNVDCDRPVRLARPMTIALPGAGYQGAGVPGRRCVIDRRVSIVFRANYKFPFCPVVWNGRKGWVSASGLERALLRTPSSEQQPDPLTCERQRRHALVKRSYCCASI
jgi:hypothetical protein